MTTGRIRVLVLDDGASERRAVADPLSQEPGLEVVATGPCGVGGLSRVRAHKPDLVVLRIGVPPEPALLTLDELRRQFREVKVLTLCMENEGSTLVNVEALLRGAHEALVLPPRLDAWPRALEDGAQRARALCSGSPRGGPAARENPASRARSRRDGPPLVAVGCSTGGPMALATLLAGLKKPFPAPVVIAQHMPPDFTRFLAERLAAASALPVREAQPGVEVLPGQVWVARGDEHLVVSVVGGAVILRTLRTPPENSCRPSVDVLFRSVAAVYGARALAVVLTGMGQDGLQGCAAIRAAGGQVLVQDEATSVVWGMPGHVTREGLADRVLPIEQMAAEVGTRVAQLCGESPRPPSRGEEGPCSA